MQAEGESGSDRIGGAARFLRFRLGVQAYAFFLEQVSGLVSTASPFRTVAGAPEAVLGLSEWKGRLLTVIDLPGILAVPPGSGPSSLVRLCRPFEFTALYVPAPVVMESLPLESIRAYSEPGVPAEGCLELGGETVILLEPAAIVDRLEHRILRGITGGTSPCSGRTAAAGGE